VAVCVCCFFLLLLLLLQSADQVLTAKLYVGIEPDHPYQVIGKVLGAKGSYLKHIAQQSNAKVYLRGKGSRFAQQLDATDPAREDNLHVLVEASNNTSLERAKKLAENLLSHTRRDCESRFPPSAHLTTPQQAPVQQQHITPPPPLVHRHGMPPGFPGAPMPRPHFPMPHLGAFGRGRPPPFMVVACFGVIVGRLFYCFLCFFVRTSSEEHLYPSMLCLSLELAPVAVSVLEVWNSPRDVLVLLFPRAFFFSVLVLGVLVFFCFLLLLLSCTINLSPMASLLSCLVGVLGVALCLDNTRPPVPTTSGKAKC
jgi:KH-domain type I